MKENISPLQIYTEATELAMKNRQIAGEKNDYYVTLAQLERIIQNIESRS